MFRVALLLLVVVLVASPTARVVCDISCQAGSHSNGAADAACHGAQHRSGPVLKAVQDACAHVIAVGAFITYKAVPTGSGPSLVAAVAVADSVHDLRRHDGASLPRVTSGPPLGRTLTVLRI